MKVYIKPWEEALECAKKADKKFVDKYTGNFYILNISRRAGDWGRIVEAIKEENYYTSDIDRYPFTYPACCVEEIDSAWLDAHAEIIDEQVVSQTIQYTDDEPFVLGQDYIFIIYKIRDGVKKYFFYVKRISNDMIIGNAEKIIEIK